MNSILSQVIPCLIIIATLLIVFGFIAFMRYLSYRETLALAEKGLVRPEPARSNRTGALRWGVVITSLGLATTIGLYPFGFLGHVGSQFPFYFGPWMIIGLVPTFFGLGLVLIYLLTREDKPEDQANR